MPIGIRRCVGFCRGLAGILYCATFEVVQHAAEGLGEQDVRRRGTTDTGSENMPQCSKRIADDVVLERTYDPFGRDGGLSVSGLYDVGYDYDVLGRLDEVSLSPPGQTARTFAYRYVPGADFVDGYTESSTGLTVDRTYAPDRNVLTSVVNRALQQAGPGRLLLGRRDDRAP